MNEWDSRSTEADAYHLLQTRFERVRVLRVCPLDLGHVFSLIVLGGRDDKGEVVSATRKDHNAAQECDRERSWLQQVAEVGIAPHPG